jgi:hypothetical protein
MSKKVGILAIRHHPSPPLYEDRRVVMSSDRRDYLTARHESAHALVAHLVGATVTKVTIRPDADAAGSCYWMHPGAGAVTVAKHAKDATIALAPRVAMEGFGVSEGTFSCDDADAFAAARAAVGLSPIEQSRFILGAWERARALIAAHESALADITRQLDALGELSEARFERIAREALESESRQRARWSTTFRYVDDDNQEGDPS